MKNLTSISVLLVTVALFAGCGPKKPEVPPAPPTPTADTTGVENADALAGDTSASMGPSGELLSKRIVFFDFDRADIRADSQSVVAAHSAYLAKNPNQKVRLEGHADERGSREYNIGLGERRGQSRAPGTGTPGSRGDAAHDRQLRRRTSCRRGQRRTGVCVQSSRRDHLPEVSLK